MLRRFIPALGLALLLPACADTNDPIDPQMSLVEIQAKPAGSALYAVVKARNSAGFTWWDAFVGAPDVKIRGRSGGHLVIIADQTENDAVAALVARASAPCWIGARQFGSSFYEYDNNWFWAVVGDPVVTWKNWASGEPDHNGFSAAAMNADGTWLDAAYTSWGTSVTDQKYSCYVVEIEP